MSEIQAWIRRHVEAACAIQSCRRAAVHGSGFHRSEWLGEHSGGPILEWGSFKFSKIPIRHQSRRCGLFRIQRGNLFRTERAIVNPSPGNGPRESIGAGCVHSDRERIGRGRGHRQQRFGGLGDADVAAVPEFLPPGFVRRQGFGEIIRRCFS